MSATYSVVVNSSLTVTETLDTTAAGNLAVPANTTITHNALNESYNLSGTTTPDTTVFAAFSKALSAGAVTIDLTALTGTNGASVSANGKQVVACKLVNPNTNANAITIGVGATNGYALWGAAHAITLNPGSSALFYFGTGAPTIGGTAKTLDLTGTGSQALNCEFVFG